jgi:hypothetical protein
VAAIAKAANKSLGEIEAVVGSLTQGYEGLRTAFNQNHVAYAQAIGAVDGHISVMRAVINDLQRGDLNRDAEGNIDWDLYYGWYNEHVAQESAQRAQEGSNEGKVTEAEVFGGDYGSGVRQVLESEQTKTSEGTG